MDRRGRTLTSWRHRHNAWNERLSESKGLDSDADKGRYLSPRLALVNSEQEALKLGVCVNSLGRNSIHVARFRVLASARPT